MKTKQERKDEAYKEYEKVTIPAWKEYGKVTELGSKEYWKVQELAYKEYEKKCKEIDGEKE
jgi:hypothetical protein